MTGKDRLRQLNMTEKVGTNVEKKLEHLEGEIETIKKKIDKIGQQVGVNQPSGKIKVSKTVTDVDGNLKTVSGCDAIRKLREKLRERGQLKTPEVQAIIEKEGYSRSRNAILTLMRRLDEDFDDVKFNDNQPKKNAAYKLIDKS